MSIPSAPPRESRLLRTTRRQLLAWSGGSTLLVMAILGTAVYVAVGSELASESVSQLRDRAAIIQRLGIPEPLNDRLPGAFQQPIRVTADPSDTGLVFGGPASGTLALIIAPRDVIVVAPTTPDALPSPGLAPDFSPSEGRPLPLVLTPDPTGVAAARAGETTVAESTLLGAPVRVLSVPMDVDGEHYVVQVLSDRSAEIRALDTVLLVLILGGALVLGAALLLGWLYAGRALVPIRDSLRNQRDFAADASHELRTPLAVVRANLELLRRQTGPRLDPAAAVALEDAAAETERMARLTDDLLLLARGDADAVELRREALDLADVAASALAPLLPLATREGVAVELDVAPAPMEGDPDELGRLVAILLGNAIRHAARPGRVWVRVMPAAPHGAQLTVDDDGSGILPEHRNKVFDRFWRAPDAPPGGSGLGLAIARWIAERHAGTIEAADRPGGGARLEVRLGVR